MKQYNLIASIFIAVNLLSYALTADAIVVRRDGVGVGVREVGPGVDRGPVNRAVAPGRYFYNGNYYRYLYNGRYYNYYYNGEYYLYYDNGQYYND